jgi:hypothetical protein
MDEEKKRKSRTKVRVKGEVAVPRAQAGLRSYQGALLRGLEKSRTETPCETGWADSASNLKSSGGMSMLSHKRLEPVGAGLFNKAHLIVEFPDGTTSTFTVPRPAQLDATRQNARGFLDPNRYLSDPNRHFEMQP